MINVPTPNRWVLFAVEGEDLYHWRVVHVTGTVKLIHVAIEARHVPNVFFDAEMVGDKQLFRDTKQIVVPPTEHFLDVSVKFDRDVYGPREEATLSIVRQGPRRQARPRPSSRWRWWTSRSSPSGRTTRATRASSTSATSAATACRRIACSTGAASCSRSRARRRWAPRSTKRRRAATSAPRPTTSWPPSARHRRSPSPPRRRKRSRRAC